ncbi:hypothetical protein LXL04_007825 [Taraxacum kok-saghyz]
MHIYTNFFFFLHICKLFQKKKLFFRKKKFCDRACILAIFSPPKSMLVQVRTIIKFENGGTNLARYKSHAFEDKREEIAICRIQMIVILPLLSVCGTSTLQGCSQVFEVHPTDGDGDGYTPQVPKTVSKTVPDRYPKSPFPDGDGPGDEFSLPVGYGAEGHMEGEEYGMGVRIGWDNTLVLGLIRAEQKYTKPKIRSENLRIRIRIIRKTGYPKIRISEISDIRFFGFVFV